MALYDISNEYQQFKLVCEMVIKNNFVIHFVIDHDNRRKEKMYGNRSPTRNQYKNENYKIEEVYVFNVDRRHETSGRVKEEWAIKQCIEQY